MRGPGSWNVAPQKVACERPTYIKIEVIPLGIGIVTHEAFYFYFRVNESEIIFNACGNWRLREVSLSEEKVPMPLRDSGYLHRRNNRKEMEHSYYSLADIEHYNILIKSSGDLR